MKKALIIILATGTLIALGSFAIDMRVDESTVQEVKDLLTADDIVVSDTDALPVLGTMPELEGFASWINSEALMREDLKGKVVLVDFWTYSCINYIRTFPYLVDWWDKYQDDDFVLLGIHTPEFGFEKDRDNVIEAMEKHGLKFPVAQDNDFVTWKNFNNRYWPAKYLFDKEGQLRYVHFGEGKYDDTEKAIQQLLAVDKELTVTDAPTAKGVKSPETYFGYWRSENFASNEALKQDESRAYSFPASLGANEWALEGEWNIERQHAQAQEKGAKFRFRYNASVANLVMAIDGGDLQDIVVYLDGKEVPDDLMGAHVKPSKSEDGTFTTVSFSDLYELIAGEPGEHILEIETLEAGLQIFAITFG